MNKSKGAAKSNGLYHVKGEWWTSQGQDRVQLDSVGLGTFRKGSTGSHVCTLQSVKRPLKEMSLLVGPKDVLAKRNFRRQT